MAEADTERFAPLLARARTLADTLLAPRAAVSDQAPSPPLDNLRALADAGLLGLTTPGRYGGQGAPPAVVRAYQEIVAAACGVTSFVQLQHHTACRMIADGDNAALADARLPDLAAGRTMAGAVAFSHLRRPEPPAVRAVPDADGWVFDGEAPWFTGWGAMSEVVLGGTLPDGRLLYVLVPLDSAGLSAAPPLPLCAMNASGTVTLACRGLRVPRDRYVKMTTLAEMAARDRESILALTWQPFAVADAAIALVRGLAERRGTAALAAAVEALAAELAAARAAVDVLLPRTAAPDFAARALPVRAWSIELGVRAAHTAVAATGGGALALTAPAQRLLREALVYTVLMQTPAVQEATLARLSQDARAATAADRGLGGAGR